MSKTTLLSLLLLSFCTGLMAQDKKPSIQKAANTICACMDSLKLDSSDLEATESKLTECFMTGGMADIMALAEERGLDIGDTEAMEGLGKEIGMELMKQNCKSFVNFSIMKAKNQRGGTVTEAAAAQTTSGTLVRVDAKDFRYLVVRDKSNREHSFLWYGYFEGSEQLVGDKFKKFIGKPISIRWVEREVYLTRANDYFKIKEISGVKW
jgi:hypothetical protein